MAYWDTVLRTLKRPVFGLADDDGFVCAALGSRLRDQAAVSQIAHTLTQRARTEGGVCRSDGTRHFPQKLFSDASRNVQTK